MANPVPVGKHRPRLQEGLFSQVYSVARQDHYVLTGRGMPGQTEKPPQTFPLNGPRRLVDWRQEPPKRLPLPLGAVIVVDIRHQQTPVGDRPPCPTPPPRHLRSPQRTQRVSEDTSSGIASENRDLSAEHTPRPIATEDRWLSLLSPRCFFGSLQRYFLLPV